MPKEQDTKKKFELMNKRGMYVVKSNDLIQNLIQRDEKKLPAGLTVIEQKIIGNLISLVKPTDKVFETYKFSFKDFCQLCNIDDRSGGNYEMIKSTIEKLSSKSFWVKQGKKQILCHWINKAALEQESGIVELRLDDTLMTYLLAIRRNYTKYELANILGMQSKYSPIIYELAKSNEYKKVFTISLDKLKEMINGQHYKNFSDFKRFILEPALKEINELTDILLSYKPIKQGRKYTDIQFTVTTKTPLEMYQARTNLIERESKQQCHTIIQ